MVIPSVYSYTRTQPVYDFYHSYDRCASVLEYLGASMVL